MYIQIQSYEKFKKCLEVLSNCFSENWLINGFRSKGSINCIEIVTKITNIKKNPTKECRNGIFLKIIKSSLPTIFAIIVIINNEKIRPRINNNIFIVYNFGL